VVTVEFPGAFRDGDYYRPARAEFELLVEPPPAPPTPPIAPPVTPPAPPPTTLIDIACASAGVALVVAASLRRLRG
jgi:hypothetical protein